MLTEGSGGKAAIHLILTVERTRSRRKIRQWAMRTSQNGWMRVNHVNLKLHLRRRRLLPRLEFSVRMGAGDGGVGDHVDTTKAAPHALMSSAAAGSTLLVVLGI